MDSGVLASWLETLGNKRITELKNILEGLEVDCNGSHFLNVEFIDAVRTSPGYKQMRGAEGTDKKGIKSTSTESEPELLPNRIQIH